MIKTDEEAIEYWNRRFEKHGNVGWGSKKRTKWYTQKKDAIARVIQTGNIKI